MEKRLLGVTWCGVLAFSISLIVLQTLPLFMAKLVPFIIFPLLFAVGFALSGISLIRLRNWARFLFIFLMVVWLGVGLSVYLVLLPSKGENLSFFMFLMVFILPAVFSISYLSSPVVKSRFEDAIHWLGKKVLVIDDDKGFVRMMRTNLVSRGFEVFTSLTGEKGLSFAKTRNPDLIILDVILPGIKGREVCARLKQEPQTKDIPVIFLTAKNSPDDVRAEMEVGGVTHITKPVDFQRLLGEMRRILNIH